MNEARGIGVDGGVVGDQKQNPSSAMKKWLQQSGVLPALYKTAWMHRASGDKYVFVLKQEAVKKTAAAGSILGKQQGKVQILAVS